MSVVNQIPRTREHTRPEGWRDDPGINPSKPTTIHRRPEKPPASGSGATMPDHRRQPTFPIRTKSPHLCPAQSLLRWFARARPGAAAPRTPLQRPWRDPARLGLRVDVVAARRTSAHGNDARTASGPGIRRRGPRGAHRAGRGRCGGDGRNRCRRLWVRLLESVSHIDRSHSSPRRRRPGTAAAGDGRKARPIPRLRCGTAHGMSFHIDDSHRGSTAETQVRRPLDGVGDGT